MNIYRHFFPIASGKTRTQELAKRLETRRHRRNRLRRLSARMRLRRVKAGRKQREREAESKYSQPNSSLGIEPWIQLVVVVAVFLLIGVGSWLQDQRDRAPSIPQSAVTR